MNRSKLRSMYKDVSNSNGFIGTDDYVEWLEDYIINTENALEEIIKKLEKNNR